MASILQSVLGVSLLRIREETANVQVWTNLKVNSVEIGTDSQTARSPIQTRDLTEQNVFVDLQSLDIKNSKIIRPNKMRIVFLTDNTSDVEGMERSFFDVAQTYEIYSKNVIATNMLLIDVLIEQLPTMLSAVRITAEFEQGLKPTPLLFLPENAANTSMFGVSLNNLANTGVEAVSRVADKVSSYFGGNV